MADSLPAVKALLEAGCGLAWLPCFVIEIPETSKNIVNVLPEYHSKPVNVYAVHAFNEHCPYIVKLCIETIKEQLNTNTE